MQIAAYGPEEELTAAEAAILMGREDAGLNELFLGLIGIKVFCEPMKRVQIAQAARPFFDVRLDLIARSAGA